jgi:hypothetical protein
MANARDLVTHQLTKNRETEALLVRGPGCRQLERKARSVLRRDQEEPTASCEMDSRSFAPEIRGGDRRVFYRLEATARRFVVDPRVVEIHPYGTAQARLVGSACSCCSWKPDVV